MTKLEAIQQMHRLAGKPPPVALDSAQSSTAGKAERILDEEDKDIQSTGWHFNHEYDVELTVASSQIAVASTILWIDSYGADEDMDVVQQGGYLYDRKTNANDEFTSNIKVELIRKIDFASVPHAIARYITAAAAERFLFEVEKDDKKLARLNRRITIDKARWFAEAKRKDQKTADINLLNTDRARRVRGRRRQYPLTKLP